MSVLENSLTRSDCREAINQCTCFSVRTVGRLIANIYDSHLRSLGLNSGQLVTLLAIRMEEPLTIGELSDIIALERTAMGRALRPLENAGLVSVETDSEDHRKRTVSVSSSGIEKIESAIPYWQAAQNEVNEKIGSEHTKGLLDTLHEVKEKLKC